MPFMCVAHAYIYSFSTSVINASNYVFGDSIINIHTCMNVNMYMFNNTISSARINDKSMTNFPLAISKTNTMVMYMYYASVNVHVHVRGILVAKSTFSLALLDSVN